MHRYTVNTLRRLIKAPAAERATVFASAHEHLSRLAEDAFEAKALLYLDVRAWLAIHLPSMAPPSPTGLAPAAAPTGT